MEPRNRFQEMNSASLCSLAGRYDNAIPPRFLAPIDSLQIPAQAAILSRKQRRRELQAGEVCKCGHFGSESKDDEQHKQSEKRAAILE